MNATTSLRMPSRLLVRLLVVAVFAAILLLAGPGSASAASDPSVPDPGTGAHCSAGWEEDRVASDTYLPLNRWSGSTASFHSRTAGGLSLDIFGKIQRDLGAGSLLSIGDLFWSGTIGLTTFATQFCAIDSFGRAADQSAAVLGNALIHPSGGGFFIVGLIVVSMVSAAFSGWRRNGSLPWKQFASKLLVVGLFAGMLNGAMNTTDDEFGTGSPGWLVSTLNGVITAVASGPATAISMNDLSEDDVGPGDPSGHVMSCQRYEAELRQYYWDTHGNYASVAGMPLVLNSIWESTGLEAWKTAQFGQNEHADWVYCRLLDDFAGVPVGVPSPSTDGSAADVDWSPRIQVMNRYWDSSVPTPNPDAIAHTPVNDKTRDVSLVGWALCEPDGNGGWQYRSAADGLLSDRGNSASLEDANADVGEDDGGRTCGGWWNHTARAGSGGFHDGGSVFNWRPDVENIIDNTDGEDRDFLLTMHSNKAGNSTMVAFGYLLSSMILFAVFGFLSLAIIIAKFLLIVMIISVFVMLAMSLLPKVSVANQIGNFSSKLLGLILLTAGAILIFSLVGAFTRIMIDMGATAFEQGSVMSLLWSGVSPLAALVAMSFIFTKVLKVPNPMSVKGAMAWGAASGAVGGAVGGTVGGAVAGNRMTNALSRSGRRATDDAVSSVVSKATGGRIEARRRSGGRYGMEPRRRHSQGQQDARKTAAEAGADGASAKAGDATGMAAGKTSPHQRAEAQRAKDQAALEAAGVAENSTKRERKEALRAHRKQQVSDARSLSRQQWHQRNGASVRSAIDKRRETDAPAGTADGFKPSRKVALKPRHVTGAAKDVARKRLKVARDSFRAAPMASIGRGTKKVVTTSAKAAGVGLAAAAMGPALPFAAAGVGGLAVANKARKSQTYDRMTGNRRSLAALNEHTRSQAAAPDAPETAPALVGQELPPDAGAQEPPAQSAGEGQDLPQNGRPGMPPPSRTGSEPAPAENRTSGSRRPIPEPPPRRQAEPPRGRK